jgi:hypothetical protein
MIADQIDSLDEETELEIVATPRRKVNAYCTSPLCTMTKGKKGRWVTKGPKLVNVPKSETFCPDCEHALFWGESAKEAS